MDENKFYKQAVNCVSGYILNEQRRIFEECNRDLDTFYRSNDDSDMYFSSIIESGKKYELGYHKCTCPQVASGECMDPEHCECSRQSILFILKELMPEKRIQVEIMESVLRGSSVCRFQITFE